MQTVLNSFSIAFRAIFANKTRSMLTMLGIIIGVGSVILLTSIGNGIQSYVTGQFNSLGANNINILPGGLFGEGGGFGGGIPTSKLRLRDAQTVAKLRDHILTVTPAFEGSAKVTYAQHTQSTTIVGTGPSYVDAANTKVQEGRFFTQEEYNTNEHVAVIGPEIATKIFGSIDPVGKKTTIGSQSFKVVGVTEAKGGGGIGPSFDTRVMIPIQIALELFSSDQLTTIIVQAKSQDDIQPAIDDIKKALSVRLKPDDFSVLNEKDILGSITQILGVLTLGLGGIAAISLVVGGIGILNIMLVSVIERTREIGLRKALGATPNIIMMQFLIEAATLSLFGGIIGTVVAYLLTLAINTKFPAVVTPGSVMLAFGVSAAIGIIFGVVPARQASKLSPIEALRYE
ncbi:hypothetical protein C5B42_03880 [Candidatus Cerribacteria bacterium 'Amazon FNV 2010 28 9']|uniref:Multidrug ABC transporter substrate-binding protein n=1 Tax=Candidatus Cerribacteria bacterium 'Amazon FNV 2010 28 9' TaxID=2081795 RepID=A0A317JNE7_9BACT|nr:MAG: hypothetical protein C5B42_03880 [Candidatus Cerribacteria bacterium 'Amazon FNV 2010 28 9']